MYARLALANKDMEPELVCVTAENKAGGYGELEGGFTFTTSLAWAQRYGGPRHAKDGPRPRFLLANRHRRCPWPSWGMR